MAQSFKRTAYYYRIFTPDGSEEFAHKLRKVCSLSENEREFEHDDTTVNISIAADLTIDGKKTVTGIIRILRYVAPSIGERGTLNSHPIKLDEDQGVNEKTHFVYLPDAHALAVEYNHYGPKIGLLVKLVNELYVKHFDEHAKDSSYIYISAKNAWEKLEDADGIRTVTFEYADLTSKADKDMLPYGTAAHDLLSSGVPHVAQITLKPEKGAKGIMMSIKEFSDKFKKSLTNGQLTKLKAKVVHEGETGSVEEIDFVKDKLVADFSVVLLTPGTKEINSSFLLEAMTQDIIERGL